MMTEPEIKLTIDQQRIYTTTACRTMVVKDFQGQSCSK